MVRIAIAVAVLSGVLGSVQEAAAQAQKNATPANASASRQAPLPPGGAASVREAQGVGRPLLYWAAGGAAIIAGVILLAQDNDGTSTTSTTGTN
jgi:hypothetical protein